MNKNGRNQYGFSLIEVLIALAIVAIVAAIALPSYGQYVTKSRRADGIAELSRVMQQQEKYFLNELTYVTDLSTLGFPVENNAVTSQGEYYTIKASACQGSTISRCVRLTASPQGPQAKDGWLSLDSKGTRQWQKNKSGETGWP